MLKLSARGVGAGSQECNCDAICPVAVARADDAARLHQITAPIVEGSGDDLPGLLGLRALEHERGILDCGDRKLYFPGPGEVQVILTPGSVGISTQGAQRTSGRDCR
jgi:hypothetical protein